VFTLSGVFKSRKIAFEVKNSFKSRKIALEVEKIACLAIEQK